MLIRALVARGHECVNLTRRVQQPPNRSARQVFWDGSSAGKWFAEVDGADVVVNLAGRSVDCRYTRRNLDAMLRSRTESTRIIGEAIAVAKRPPRVWLQAGTATIYSHRFDAPNDDVSGEIGGHESDAPPLWRKSVDIALAWEAAQAAAQTPLTRKVVMRTAMVMSPDNGGVFSVLARLCRFGLGRHGDGRQYVSWIHEHDFCATVNMLVHREDLAGAFNLSSPHPLPNREFIAGLHSALGVSLSIPLPQLLLEVGAFFMRTETELLLKSRRVVPTRLLGEGFKFEFGEWERAASDLVARMRSSGRSSDNR